MKRHKRLYEEVYSFENLLLAAHKAQRGKRSRRATAEFNHRLEKELIRLQGELQAQTYRPGPFRTFTVYEEKPRLICAAPYRDRVVHHALCNVVEPLFERTFIWDSYACRKGKGTHAAVARLTQFMQGSLYALQCDIRQYFASVDHAILKSLIGRKIGCERTLWLTEAIIDHAPATMGAQLYLPGDDLFRPIERPRGLPIGNQTSQFFANVYLDPLDHFLKETVGCHRYIRYVDDLVVLGDEKAALWAVRDAMADFLETRLRLALHPRKQTVYPIKEGLSFLGYRVFPTHRRLRSANGHRFARRLQRLQSQYAQGRVEMREVKQRVSAWIGHAAHADTWGLRTAILEEAVFSRA